MSNVYLAYSPNDYFYVDISNIGIQDYDNQLSNIDCVDILSKTTWVDMNKFSNINNAVINNVNNDSDISGSSKISWDISCNNWFSDNSLNCIRYQLCKNKMNAESIKSLDTKHTSDFAKDIDTNDKFKKIFLNTVNLTIGVLFLLIVITKLFTKK